MTNPFLIDTHAHVNFKAFKDDGHQIIKQSLAKNIWVINVGAQYSTSKRAVEYAQKYPEGVYAAVGLHPSHISEEFDAEKYRKLLENSKVVAMGEIGLDYLGDHITDEVKEQQKEAFLSQLDLARQLDKPIVFHCRKAYEDLIEILDMFNLGCVNCPMACAPKLRGVFHCFMGRWSQAEKLIEMGFYFGFNGLITYARDYDKVIKNLPLEKIVLETDCPYLTPVPHRNKRNKPIYVKYVAEKIAQLKKSSLEEVAEQTTKNARELFGI